MTRTAHGQRIVHNRVHLLFFVVLVGPVLFIEFVNAEERPVANETVKKASSTSWTSP